MENINKMNKVWSSYSFSLFNNPCSSINLVKKDLKTMIANPFKGVDQARISSLLRGHLDLFLVEMLMHFLNALGQNVEIVVKPKPRNRKLAHLSVYVPSSKVRNTVPIASKASSIGL
jgi:hypothetical protein